MKEGRKPEYPEKTPGDELQKMPHTTARRFKPQARLESAQKHWWQASNSRHANRYTIRQASGRVVTGVFNFSASGVIRLGMFIKATGYFKILSLYLKSKC